MISAKLMCIVPKHVKALEWRTWKAKNICMITRVLQCPLSFTLSSRSFWRHMTLWRHAVTSHDVTWRHVMSEKHTMTFSNPFAIFSDPRPNGWAVRVTSHFAAKVVNIKYYTVITTLFIFHANLRWSALFWPLNSPLTPAYGPVRDFYIKMWH